MPISKVYLKGDLGERFTPEIELEINCVRDAIRLLEVNYPGFREHLIRCDEAGIGFQVFVGEEWNLSEVEIYYPVGAQPITIIPVAAGSGGFGKILSGVGLLALGLSGVGLLGIAPATIALTGGVMVLQGIVGLFNRPKGDADEEEAQKSLMINGAVNTAAAGGVMPIVYGELIAGSQVASGSVRSKTIIFDDD